MRTVSTSSSTDPEVVKEGWLTKSPAQWRMRLPRANWNQRYFVLTSGTLPGQCKLEYYHDETKRKKHGTIDINDVEQVDSYLTYQAGKHRTYQWIFDVRMQRRQMFLVAKDESEMNDWVHHLCHVCHLEREEPSDGSRTTCLSNSYTMGPKTPDELISNMLNETLDSRGNEDRLHPFVFHQPQVELDDNDPEHYLRALNRPSLELQVPTPDPKKPREPYIKLWDDCISASPRPTPKSPMNEHPVYDSVPFGAGNLSTGDISHVRGHSSDSTASSIQVSDDGEGIDGVPLEKPPKLPVDLNSVPPPPRPPRGQTGGGTYANEMDRQELPFSYQAPPPPQNVLFGSWPKDGEDNLDSVPPRIQKRDLSDLEEAVVPRKQGGYTDMTGKHTHYESMSPFAFPDPLPEDMETNENEASECYQNLVEVQKPPKTDAPPPPVPDRSLKPIKKSDPVWAQHQNPEIKVERKASFVRKQQGAAGGARKTTPPVPKLPKTPPKRISGPRDHQKIEAEIQKKESSPLAITRKPPLDYIEVETGTPPSARTPSPGFHQLNCDEEAFPTQNYSPSSRLQYAQIDQTATRAVSKTLQEHDSSGFRSLERDQKKKFSRPAH